MRLNQAATAASAQPGFPVMKPEGSSVRVLHMKEVDALPPGLLSDLSVQTVIRVNDDSGLKMIYTRRNDIKDRSYVNLANYEIVHGPSDIWDVTIDYKGISHGEVVVGL